MAAKDSEVKVDEVLRVLLAGGEEEISTQGIAAMLGVDRSAAVRDVQVAAVDLGVFDQLCSAQEVLQ